MTPSGVTGVDLKLSPLAQSLIPYDWECKLQESLNIYKALEQARAHAAKSKNAPVVAFRKNRTELFVAVSFKLFLDLIRK